MKLGLNRTSSILCGTLACIGIVFIFLTPLKVQTLNSSTALTVEQVYFTAEGTIIPVLAFALLMVGGLCTIMFGLNQNKVVGYVGMGILLLASLLLYCTDSLYLASKGLENGVKFSELSKYVKAYKDVYVLGFGPSLGVTCGLIGALSTPIVLFVFED